MNKYLTSSIGRLRLLGFLEGTSLLVLVFIAVPFKYFLDNHSLVESIGPVHGVLFILFVVNALHVGFLQQWKLTGTTMKVMVSSFIPFGTFYIDNKILRPIHISK
ncbi:MAG: DUF3817 domain-containing protein [Bacteroidetes bacterium]|nr:DUF3817 domain-containing protein [Bacteroidota bacterium]